MLFSMLFCGNFFGKVKVMHALNAIALIGLRGSGKTTLGKSLANKLGFTFFDLDIVFQEKMKQTIANFILTHTWEDFRKIETQILFSMPKNKVVLSCGGGVILKEENRQKLFSDYFTVFLNVPVDELVKRLEKNALKEQRPAFTNKSLYDEMQELYDNRIGFYQETAHLIETNFMQKEKQLEHIMDIFIQQLEKTKGE